MGVIRPAWNTEVLQYHDSLICNGLSMFYQFLDKNKSVKKNVCFL